MPEQRRVPGHETFRIESVPQRPQRCVAVCTCGWRSEESSSAGLAGAHWDDHSAAAGHAGAPAATAGLRTP